ncbi:PAS domain S-box protein [candidate division WOR-3 bacterium]|nr:PAS domain S-box protein [candidate division WOR-3 bacterium]
MAIYCNKETKMSENNDFSKRAEELFLVLKNQTGILLWSLVKKEGEYYYEFVNDGFASVENKNSNYYENRKVRDIHEADEYIAIEKTLIKTKELGSYEYKKKLSKNGSIKQFLIKIVYNAPKENFYEHWTALGSDITELIDIQTRLEKSEEKHKFILESLKNPVLVLDETLRVLFCNLAYAEFSGIRKNEIEGRIASEVIPDFYNSKAYNACLSVLKTGLSESCEATIGDKKVCYSVHRTKEGVIAVLEDITERKRAENNLQRERDVYHSLIESSALSKNVFDFCSDFLNEFVKILSLDKASVRLIDGEKLELVSQIGFPPEELDEQKKSRFLSDRNHITSYVAMTKTPIFAPDTKEHVLGELFSDSFVKKGIKSLFSWPLTGDAGDVFGVMHLIGKKTKDFSERDRIFFENTAKLFSAILEKKLSQEKLTKSEETLRNLQENIPLGLFRTDLEGKIVSANSSFVKIFGYSDFKELEKTPVFTLYANPSDREILIKQHMKQEVVRDFEIQMKKKNKDIIYCMVNEKHIKDADGSIVYIDGSIEDITQKKETQTALKETQDRYRLLYESADDAIFILKDDIFIDCNEKACEMFKQAKKKLVGNKPFVVSPPFQADGSNSSEKAILKIEKAKRGEPQRFDWLHKRGDGTVFDAEVSLNPFSIGKIVYLQAIVRDYTEKNKIIKALRDSEDKFKQFLEIVPDVLFRLDLKNNRFELLSPYIEELLGYPLHLAYSDPKNFLFSILHEDDRKNIEKAISDIYSGPEKTNFLEIPFRAVKADGAFLWLNAKIRFERERGEITRANGVLSDITQQVKMEKELLKIEKLESVGILAGGIAHDFNNILTGILGNISLSRVYIDKSSESWGLLEEAETAAVKAKNLTRQLLTFSKGGKPVKKTVELKDFLKETCVFATRGSNCGCAFRFDDGLMAVEIDEGQMIQVINNVIINAVQAMPNGGFIKVTAVNETVAEKFPLPIEKGNYVVISIEDSGAGMSDDTKARIFDPFFTTKESGSGLGLTTAFSVVKNHGGHIEAFSKKEEGTTFRIYLPASREKPVPAGEKSKAKRGKGKILIMDDEEMVLSILSEMLTYLGYDICATKNGESAAEEYKKAYSENASFDAVIMDLTVQGGGMGGREAVKIILEIDKNAKVFVSSGYSDDPVISEYKKYGFTGSLSKPYSLEELSGLLESELSSDHCELDS